MVVERRIAGQKTANRRTPVHYGARRGGRLSRVLNRAKPPKIMAYEEGSGTADTVMLSKFDPTFRLNEVADSKFEIAVASMDE